MKRLAALALILALLCPAALAAVGMANPWTETTAEALMQALGVQFGVPEGAEDIVIACSNRRTSPRCGFRGGARSMSRGSSPR